MPAESHRTAKLREIFDLPETGKLPAYSDIEAFTSPAQQSSAMSLFPDSWRYLVRTVEDVQRNSFSRIMPRGSVTWIQARGVNLPEGAPVHNWRIDEAGNDGVNQALTLIMKTEGRLVPGDVFCLEAIEAFMGARGLSPAEQPPLELAPN
jgi:hypothetical protein